MNLYYIASAYSDGSLRLDYFTDAAHTNNVGFFALDAPLWNGSSGTYPVLLRAFRDVTLAGVRWQGATALLINNPQASSAIFATIAIDSRNNSILNVVTVQNSVLIRRFLIRSGGAFLQFLTATAPQQNIQEFEQITASNGLQGAVALLNDNSGRVILQLNSVVVYDLQWDRTGAGCATFSTGQRECFSNVQNYLAR